MLQARNLFYHAVLFILLFRFSCSCIVTSRLRMTMSQSALQICFIMLCFSFCCYVFPVVTLLSRLRMTMYIGHITNCILHYMLCMSLFITSIHICSRWYPTVACWVCCKFSVICSYLNWSYMVTFCVFMLPFGASAKSYYIFF